MTDSERDRLDDLIAELEAASSESINSKLSKEIARFMGTYKIHYGDEPHMDRHEWPFYCSSIDAALTLVPEEWTIYGVDGPAMDHDGLWTWFLVAGERDTDGTSHDPALALCIAALKARREGGDDE